MDESYDFSPPMRSWYDCGCACSFTGGVRYPEDALLFLVEGFGLPARDAQRLPVGGLEVLGEEDDLADVLAVVRELSVDGLDDGVRLAADDDVAHQVVGPQLRERVEEEAPAGLPVLLDGAAVFALDKEFGVASAVGLLAVARQEVGPARAHVAGHVLHDEGDAVRLRVYRAEEFFVADLRGGLVRELLEAAELRRDVFDVVLCERVGHLMYSPSKKYRVTK